MRSEPFSARVFRLHEGWAERREFESLPRGQDRESQYVQLLTLHRWAKECLADICQVYGPALTGDAGPVPGLKAEPAAFIVNFGRRVKLVFMLKQQARSETDRWTVVASLETAGTPPRFESVGPDRRNGHWTRQRLEDVLLSALGAYERSLSPNESPARQPSNVTLSKSGTPGREEASDRTGGPQPDLSPTR